MRLSKSRKKSWRRIRRTPYDSPLIRQICCSVLILELAFGVQAGMVGGILEVSRSEESVTKAQSPLKEKEPDYERTSGVKIRLKDGQIDFYRKEEFKSTD